MSELNIKAYSELDISDTLTKSSYIVIEEEGYVKRFPANSIGKVNTVNGAEPDENGNVEIQPVQSDWEQTDSTAANYIKNKPFGETESNTLLWDGTPTDTMVSTTSAELYHVSDETPEPSLFIGGTVSVHSEKNGDSAMEITADLLSEEDGVCVIANAIFVIYKENTVCMSMTFAKTGIYFMYMTVGGGTYVNSLTLPNYKFATFKTIDEAVIPDTIARIDDILKPVNKEFVFTWDGNTEGLESFVRNDVTYYKISDFAVPTYRIYNCNGTYSDGSATTSNFGDNHGKEYLLLGELGFASGVLASKAGEFTAKNPGGLAEITCTVPSAGVYFAIDTDDEGKYIRHLTLTSRSSETGIRLKSYSGKEFSLYVRDDGTLATEPVV